MLFVWAFIGLYDKFNGETLFMQTIPIISNLNRQWQNYQLERQRIRTITLHDPTNPANYPFLKLIGDAYLLKYSTQPPKQLGPLGEELLLTRFYTLASHEFVGHTLVATTVLPNVNLKQITVNPSNSLTDCKYDIPNLTELKTKQTIAVQEIIFKLAGLAIDMNLTPQNKDFNLYSAVQDLFDSWWIASEKQLPLKKIQILTAETDQKIAKKIATGTSAEWIEISKTVLSEPLFTSLLVGTQKILGTIPLKILSAMHTDLASKGTFVGHDFIQSKLKRHLGKKKLADLKIAFKQLVDTTVKNINTPTQEALLNWKINQFNAEQIVQHTPTWFKWLSKVIKR
jgi:hypothetical protein